MYNINISTSGQISEPPQQYATDQGDVSASVTINSAQELQLTPVETNTSAVFNPEIVKPLPKAPSRVQTVTKRRKRKMAVLTVTPGRNALAEEQVRKGKENNNNKGKVKGKGKGKAKAQVKAKRNKKARVIVMMMMWNSTIALHNS
ncbi:hypothetical protein HHI36_004005 [Cryptolaemus montrouzieri]|uniref:Uncharacterized protein n=1 Tax=Cryptolaemus montrouzieri TaxID=559131 RepID=A0ABD2NPV5_9CUCU